MIRNPRLGPRRIGKKPIEESWTPCKSFSNSLLFWYPRIQKLVPTPKTMSIPLEQNVYTILDNGLSTKFVDKVAKAIQDGPIKQGYKYPFFMRTDIISEKFNWDETCFLQRESDLGEHMIRLLDYSMAHMMIQEPQAIVIREFLHLPKYFTLKHGMPVSKEFRFFAQKGNVKCFHPMWPHQVIDNHEASEATWRTKLHMMEHLEIEDNELLLKMAAKASTPFEDKVSLDFCQDVNKKWYLTDAHCASQSFHWLHKSRDGGSEY